MGLPSVGERVRIYQAFWRGCTEREIEEGKGAEKVKVVRRVKDTSNPGNEIRAVAREIGISLSGDEPGQVFGKMKDLIGWRKGNKDVLHLLICRVDPATLLPTEGKKAQEKRATPVNDSGTSLAAKRVLCFLYGNKHRKVNGAGSYFENAEQALQGKFRKKSLEAIRIAVEETIENGWTERRAAFPDRLYFLTDPATLWPKPKEAETPRAEVVSMQALAPAPEPAPLVPSLFPVSSSTARTPPRTRRPRRRAPSTHMLTVIGGNISHADSLKWYQYLYDHCRERDADGRVFVVDAEAKLRLAFGRGIDADGATTDMVANHWARRGDGKACNRLYLLVEPDNAVKAAGALNNVSKKTGRVEHGKIGVYMTRLEAQVLGCTRDLTRPQPPGGWDIDQASPFTLDDINRSLRTATFPEERTALIGRFCSGKLVVCAWPGTYKLARNPADTSITQIGARRLVLVSRDFFDKVVKMRALAAQHNGTDIGAFLKTVAEALQLSAMEVGRLFASHDDSFNAGGYGVCEAEALPLQSLVVARFVPTAFGACDFLKSPSQKEDARVIPPQSPDGIALREKVDAVYRKAAEFRGVVLTEAELSDMRCGLQEVVASLRAAATQRDISSTVLNKHVETLTDELRRLLERVGKH